MECLFNIVCTKIVCLWGSFKCWVEGLLVMFAQMFPNKGRQNKWNLCSKNIAEKCVVSRKMWTCLRVMCVRVCKVAVFPEISLICMDGGIKNVLFFRRASLFR